MFRLFKRKASPQSRGGVDAKAVVEEVRAARWAEGSLGQLSEGVLAGGPEHEPAPDYVAEASTPSEEAWAREEARYRAKNEGDPPA
jgi:hypothetical protein